MTNAAFDDSLWPYADSYMNWLNDSSVGFSGTGWFRFHATINSSLWNKTVSNRRWSEQLKLGFSPGFALYLNNINNGTFRYSSAGIPPLLILRKKTGTVEKFVRKAKLPGAFYDFPYCIIYKP